MLDSSVQALIQQAIWYGYRASASVLGKPHSIYRPTSAVQPISPETLVTVLPAIFTPSDRYGFKEGAGYAKALWSVLVDGNQTRPGDILVGETTWYIASMEPDLPIMAVRCSSTVTVTRPTSTTGIGLRAPSGDVVTQETTLMAGWPASILQGTKGEKPDSGLPDDVRAPWAAILLPAVEGVELRTDDIITDETDRRFVISGCERSYMGWRLTAEFAGS